MRKMLVLKSTGMLKAAVDDSWGLEKRDHQARTPDHSLRPIFLWKSARIQEQPEVRTREACPVALISLTLGHFLSWSVFFMTDVMKYKTIYFEECPSAWV